MVYKNLLLKILSLMFLASVLLKLVYFQETTELWRSQFSLSPTVFGAGFLLLFILELLCAIGLWEKNKKAVKLSLALLIVFTGIAGLQWYLGAENCGCFGTAISLTPQETIVKNILLISMLLYNFKQHKMEMPL